jgi:hypothetical protein
MGLVVIVALGLYLAISIGVIAWAISYAKKHGKSTKRWGWGVALAMYLLVFWDWIPTVVAHKYYCATEAGFWVYKTPEQWKKENPGVIEGLVNNKDAPSARQGDIQNYTDTYFLNNRFNWVVKHHGQFLFNRWRHEQEVVDSKTNEVLARYVDFSTSQERRQAGWSGWKFWIDSRFMGKGFCKSGGKNKDELRSFRNNFMGIEK